MEDPTEQPCLADRAIGLSAMPLLKVGVVVVTYNRQLLLEQTLHSLKGQSYPITRIIVVDNCSSDGTREMLQQMDDSSLDRLLLDRNVGGAGGFSVGIERAFRSDSDVIWVMDDDVLPASDALECLIKGLCLLREEGLHPNFVISNVFNSLGKPVNTPVLDLRLEPNGNSRWPALLNLGIIPVTASSFVGTLFTRDSLQHSGLPIAEMFIWGDDIEFTSRLTKDHEAGYLIGASRIIHLGRGTEVSIHHENDPARTENFFYFYRNNVYIMRRYGTKQRRASFVFKLLADCLQLSAAFEFRKLYILVRGVACGLVFNPAIRELDHQQTQS
jgi:GT2 family glycosyltransferase